MAKPKNKSFDTLKYASRAWPVLTGGDKSYPTSDIKLLPQKLKNLKTANTRASKEDLLAKSKKKNKNRKGGPVGHRVGEQVTPNPMGGNLGVSQTNPSIPSPQVPKQAASVKKQPSPQDKLNQEIDAVNKSSKAEADQNKYKKMASLGKPKAPGMPQAQGKPQDPRILQGKSQPQPQRPPVLSRKGDTVKTQGYKRGGKVGTKGYSNVCRAANNPVA